MTGAYGSSVGRLQAMVPVAVWGDPSATSWMQVAAASLGQEIQQAWEAVAWITRQAYPGLADENGLSYWEQLLGVPINPPNLTTDQRREVVLARRHVAGAVQLPRIKALIGQYQRGTVQLVWDERSAILTLVWQDVLGVPPNVADVERALDTYLPAWIDVQQRYCHVIYQTITNRAQPYSTITASGETYAQLQVDSSYSCGDLLYDQARTAGVPYSRIVADALTYTQLVTTPPAAL